MCMQLTWGSHYTADSDFIGLEQDTQFCSSDKLLGAAAAGLWAMFWVARLSDFSLCPSHLDDILKLKLLGPTSAIPTQ